MQKRENWVFGSECGKASSGHEERKQRLWMPRPLSPSFPPSPVPVASCIRRHLSIPAEKLEAHRLASHTSHHLPRGCLILSHLLGRGRNCSADWREREVWNRNAPCFSLFLPFLPEWLGWKALGGAEQGKHLRCRARG